MLLIFNLTFIFNSGEAGKILFYTPFAAKSYKITFTPILEELSKWVSKFFKVKTFHKLITIHNTLKNHLIFIEEAMKLLQLCHSMKKLINIRFFAQIQMAQ